VSETQEQDGQLLRRLRRESGLSLQQMADRTHFNKGYLSRVENGKQSISVAVAEACDKVLGTASELTVRATTALERVRRDRMPLAQLPAAPSALVGRDGPLVRLGELLAAHQQQSGAVPIVCIDGPPGVGKTAVALRHAHDIADRYSGGVLYANLRGYGASAGPSNPGEVLDVFLRSLGADPDRIPADSEERAGMFRSLVHGRSILVVLDNAASSQQVRPLLPGSSDCAVLVTSRQRLTGLLVAAAPATSVTLNPLGPDDARELLRATIGTERIEAEPQAADSVARRCAYLPLALRIAGVRIAAHPHDSLADLAVDLSAENERLDFLAAGDEDTLTVRGVFSWSYQALQLEEARLFRLLGLHPGATFTVGVAAALIGVTWSAAQRLLDVLTEAHLVEQTGRDCYQLHDLLRVYAGEQARSTGSSNERAAALRRLVDWYLASSDAAVRALTPHRPHFDMASPAPTVHAAEFDEYDRALRWCDRELPTILGITRLAEQEQLFEQAWQLPVTWFDYFLLRRPWDEWISTNESGVRAAKQARNDFGRGWALTNLAEVHRRRGDLDTAESEFQEALRICPGRTGRGWALAGLAFTCFDRGDHRSAVEYLKQAVEVFESIDVAFGVATALANLGDAHRELGELDRAWSCGRRAYELFVSINDRPGQGYALSRMARTARQRGEYGEALGCCEQALLVNREIGDHWEEADVLEIQGTILREMGNESAGRHALAEALSLFEGVDQRRALRLRQQLVDDRRTLPDTDDSSR
jgi:tetratricopeptide (TPR) repeat protein/transcriptional regulator with XRE-family HTH domain